MTWKCPKCYGNRFKVDAVYAATDYIVGSDESPGDFEVVDTKSYHGEWEDDSNVTCCDCGWTCKYQDVERFMSHPVGIKCEECNVVHPPPPPCPRDSRHKMYWSGEGALTCLECGHNVVVEEDHAEGVAW